MDVFTAIRQRRSIRKFKQKEVSGELIDKMIEAASLAPSGLNQQPWEFVVVKDSELKKKVRNIYDDARNKLGLYKQDTTFLENACQIFVCADKAKITPVISCSLAIENMLLAATALGLGSIVTTSITFTEDSTDELKNLLKIPENYLVIALVLVGYSDEALEMKPRRSLKDIKHVDEF